VAQLSGTAPSAVANLQQPRAVRLKCAEIVGRLDLSGRRERPLPPIEFEDCIFSDQICLRGAWLGSVAFKSCQLIHIVAEECKIDGSLILKEISSSADATPLSWSDRAPSGAAESAAGDSAVAHKGPAGLGLCWVELGNASVGGDVRVESSRFCVPRPRPGFVQGHDLPRYALNLRGIEIKGSLLVEPGVQAVGGISIANARVAGNLRGNGAELLAVEGSAFFAQNCRIAGNLILSHGKSGNHPFRAIGGVWLFGAEIDGALWMQGAFVQSNQAEEAALMAPHTKVDHTFTISGSVAGPINLQNAKIGSDCALKLSVVGNLTERREPQLLVDFKNVNVKGSFQINDLRFNEPGRLLAESLATRTIVRAQTRKLLSYPGWYLVEITCRVKPAIVDFLWREVTLSLLCKGNNEAILLDGLANRFHELNEKAGVLHLDNVAEAEEYARLFAAHISGPNGPFLLLADVEEAGPELRRQLGTSTRPMAVEKVTADEPQRYLIEADVIYASTLFRARLSVSAKDGKVTMQEDDLARPVFVSTSTYFDVPYRIDADASRRLPPVFSKGWEPLPTETAEKLLADATRRPTPVYEPRAQFDLTGAAVKRLEDAGGTAVGKSVRLQLEGFRYEQIEEKGSRPHSPLWASVFQVVTKTPRNTPLWFLGLIFVLAVAALIAPVSIIVSVIRKAWELLKEGNQFIRNARQIILDRLSLLATHQFRVIRNDAKPERSWQKRVNWLALQFASNREGFYVADEATFFPQPYDQLAAVLRSQGQFEDSRRILSHKLTLERHTKRSVWLSLTWWFYQLGFDYGLSAGRALVTLLLFIALGVIAARSADRHGLLVSEQPSAQISLQTTPCSAQNSLTLYAVEEFIPVASLKSSSSCRIRAFDASKDNSSSPRPSFISRIRHLAVDPRFWRFGEVFYRILGWIILSLSIITFTGVARRHIEK
jgi:hypothetical protein